MISHILAILAINGGIGALLLNTRINERFNPKTFLSFFLLSSLWIWMIIILVKENQFNFVKEYVIDSFKEVKDLLVVRK
jgi:hypothetical protein